MQTMLIRQMRRTVGLVWLALVLALLALVAVNSFGSKLGYQTFVIRGGSMAPAIPLGALAVTQPVDTGSLVIGDVITIRAANAVIYTHRIVAITGTGAERQFQVRGDANATPDAALVPASAVIGRVSLFAPGLGYLTAMLSMPSGILSILSSLGSLLMSFWLLEDLERQAKVNPATQPEPEFQPVPSTGVLA